MKYNIGDIVYFAHTDPTHSDGLCVGCIVIHSTSVFDGEVWYNEKQDDCGHINSYCADELFPGVASLVKHISSEVRKIHHSLSIAT